MVHIPVSTEPRQKGASHGTSFAFPHHLFLPETAEPETSHLGGAVVLIAFAWVHTR